MDTHSNSTPALCNSSMTSTPAAPIDHDLYAFYFLLNGVMGIAVCAIGLIGNMLNIVILRTSLTRQTTTMFLLAMAVSDILVLFIYMIYDLVCIALPPHPMIELKDTAGSEGTFPYFVYYIWYIPTNIFTTMSNWCIVSVMSFRFVAVYFPLRARHLCSLSRAKLMVGIIAVFSIVLSIPEFLTVRIEKSDETGFVFNDTHLFTSPSFNGIYYGFLEAFNSFIPFIVCSFLSIVLVRTLGKIDRTLTSSDSACAREQNNMKRRKAEQRRISVMLLGITLWFIFCTCPSFLCRIARHFVYSNIIAYKRFVKFRGVSDMFLLLNHAANFILYALTSALYRQHFIDLICCRDRKRLQKEQTIRACTMSSRYPTNIQMDTSSCNYINVCATDNGSAC